MVVYLSAYWARNPGTWVWILAAPEHLLMLHYFQFSEFNILTLEASKLLWTLPRLHDKPWQGHWSSYRLVWYVQRSTHLQGPWIITEIIYMSFLYFKITNRWFLLICKLFFQKLYKITKKGQNEQNLQKVPKCKNKVCLSKLGKTLKPNLYLHSHLVKRTNKLIHSNITLTFNNFNFFWQKKSRFTSMAGLIQYSE